MADCTGGDLNEICFKMQMLMIFMLAFSQENTDPATKVENPLLIDLIFDGSFTDFDHHPFVGTAGLHVDSAALKFFRDQLIGTFDFATKIKPWFQNMHTLSNAILSYTGSECPSKPSLQNMLDKAKDQHV
jgi:hypothetical protein